MHKNIVKKNVSILLLMDWNICILLARSNISHNRGKLVSIDEAKLTQCHLEFARVAHGTVWLKAE